MLLVAGDPAEWDRLTIINQLSPMHITRWLTPPMVEKGAHMQDLLLHDDRTLFMLQLLQPISALDSFTRCMMRSSFVVG